MDPVDQTRFGEHGDCFFACLATVTGIPLFEFDLAYEAPDMDGADWWNETLLAVQRHGWQLVRVPTHAMEGTERKVLDLAPRGPSVAGGPSPRGPAPTDHPGHAVVYLDGEPWFDPHPSRDGLAGPPEEFYLLIPPRGRTARLG